MRIIIIILLLISNFVFSQKTEYGSHSLISSKEKLVTSYISFDGSLTNLITKDYTIGSAGVTIGSTIDRSFTIGLTTNWIFDSPNIIEPKFIFDDKYKLKKYSGYIGILLEPTLFSKFPIHVTFPCVVGIGTITYILKDDDFWTSYEEPIDKTYFWLFSFGSRIELNVADGIRISVGPSYRFVPNYITKSDNDIISNQVQLLNNISLDFSIKIGKY